MTRTVDYSVKKIIAQLKQHYPDARIILHYSNPFELLVATILSAQCTDERVNKVTEKLFRKYRQITDYANANQAVMERDIRSTGFYRNKARNIIYSAKMIQEKFAGQVPKTMEEILQLPGVARKTANIVLGNAYKVVEGIAVDTHVRRLSYRLGLSKNANPEKIEQDLMKIIPKSEWFKLPYLFQTHGRKLCMARSPRCPECFLRNICPKKGV